ncbi:MAG TPA: sulfotransferase [Steroidobacteraceae bacterium]|jgi:tetratricopeptide (TPR) repeat protein
MNLENPRALLQRAQSLLASGQLRHACEAAALAQSHPTADATVLDAIGNVFSLAGDQPRALAAFERAIALSPNEPHFVFNRATVRRFLGDLNGAERDYDRVIALRPSDYEAYLNRSELRTQSEGHNHIPELEARLPSAGKDWRGEVAMRYALAKEYEDIGQYGRSFEHLSRGAQLRREHLRYDVATDVATMDWIIEAYPGPHARPALASTVAPATTSPDVGAADAHAPIFVVGLPRSGSTLVERILGSHTALRAAGELPHFALSVVAGVSSGLNTSSTQRQTAPLPRRELVMRSAQVDFPALGRDYLSKVRAAGVEAERFIDKMPLNFLYCGLIRRALPNARIVHVRRSPMAACFAIYKKLFQDGYPFSYDLGELGRYYIAYGRLMDHWTATLPGLIHELSYEALVADPRRATQELLAFCGLEWEDACLEFHNNRAPSTTASAAQVRHRLHNNSVAQWRQYASQLEPLRRQLEAAGIDTEESRL